MPPLYGLEDYDRCLQANPDVVATYCLVKTIIMPDDTSKIWGYIMVKAGIHFESYQTSLTAIFNFLFRNIRAVKKWITCTISWSVEYA